MARRQPGEGEVKPDNQASIRVFQRLGFQEGETVRGRLFVQNRPQDAPAPT